MVMMNEGDLERHGVAAQGARSKFLKVSFQVCACELTAGVLQCAHQVRHCTPARARGVCPDQGVGVRCRARRPASYGGRRAAAILARPAATSRAEYHRTVTGNVDGGNLNAFRRASCAWRCGQEVESSRVTASCVSQRYSNVDLNRAAAGDPFLANSRVKNRPVVYSGMPLASSTFPF